MPVVFNKESGLAEDLSPEASQAALNAGTHEIPLINPEGQMGSAASSDAPDMVQQGYRQPSPKELEGMLKTAKYSSTEQQVAAGIEGLGRGVLGPASDIILESTGVDPKDILGRAEVNPGKQTAAEIAGLVTSGVAGVGLGGALTKLGAAAVPIAEGAGVGAKILTSAGRAALENMIYQGSNETSRMIMHDPEQTAESAIAYVGMAGALGLGIGGALGSVGSAFGLVAPKVSEFVSDFKGRIQEHLANPDPVATLTKEMQEFHTPLQNQAMNEVYGKSGLRQEELQKLMPEEVTPKLIEHNNEIVNAIGDKLGTMQKNIEEYPAHNVKELQRQYGNIIESIKSDKPIDAYNALNEFKRYAQGTYRALKTTDSFELPYKFLNDVKELGTLVRNSLESPAWGESGTRTKAINKAWSEFQTPLKDFNSKFTTKLGDERIIDPGKVNTYYNQIGKPNAEIKQEALTSFLDAAAKFNKVMDATHANLGLENPVGRASAQAMHATLDKLTPGAKVADALVRKGLADAAGSGAGAAIGSVAGHPILGAIFGHHALTPLMDKILPAIIKPILESNNSARGLKSAVAYTMAAVKGENNINKAAAAVFGKDMDNVIKMPSSKDRELLKEQIKKVSANPNLMMDVGSHTAHYLPQHGTAIAATTANAVNYLKNLEPDLAPRAPLDAPRKPNSIEEAKFNRALDIAENPLIIMKSIKEGSLTIQDIQHMKALFPALYTKMSNQLMTQLIDKKTDKGLIPYKTKLSLAAFMGQPLDSSMMPVAIVASQGQGMQASQLEQAKIGNAPKNMNKLDKLPAQSNTMVGSREQYRTSRH